MRYERINEYYIEDTHTGKKLNQTDAIHTLNNYETTKIGEKMKEKEISSRLKDICKVVRYGSELKIITPGQVYLKRNKELFQEQQVALENLKKDPGIEVLEENKEEIIETDEDGITVKNLYKIITIKSIR